MNRDKIVDHDSDLKKKKKIVIRYFCHITHPKASIKDMWKNH